MRTMSAALAAAPPRPASALGPRARRWEDDRFLIVWKGHLYLPGETAGAASVALLARMLRNEGLAVLARRLRGVFALLVHDRASDDRWFAVDNAGLCKVYHDRRGARTSFLGMVRDRRPRPDRAALVAFLAHGAVLGDRTLAAGIRELLGHEILHLPPGGAAPRLLKKALPAAVPPAAETVPRSFADLARSLDGRALSADATGGLDTRLILALLDGRGLPAELAVSGRPGTPDVEIAREMARLLDRPFHLSGHDLSDLDGQLVLTFRDGDGQTDLRRFHRDRQHALARLVRGVEVFAHGGGGELFRDHYVIQDFPFYGSGRVNYSRYYDLRMTPVALPPAALGPVGRAVLADLKDRTIGRFSLLRAPTNNESYDRVYFHLRSPEFYGHYFSSYVDMGLDVVAPLLDRDTALSAMALSPWARSFCLWHRRAITARRPDLAALPTAEGFGASSEPPRMLGDVGAYLAAQARRAAKKASQRLTGRARFHAAGAFVADAPGFVGRLRASPHFRRSVERLAAAGVLAGDGVGADLPDVHVGRVLTAGMFLGELDGYG